MKTSQSGIICFLAALVFPMACQAADDWLIASQNESINIGQKITLEVVKPEKLASWPENLRLKLSGSGVSEEIELTLNKTSSDSVNRRLYTGRPHQKHVGVVRGELVDMSSNRLVLLAASDDSTGVLQVTEAAPDSSVPTVAEKAPPTLIIAKPSDEPALSANEPTYFLVGSNSEHGADAKFQLSFKFRPFDPEASTAGFLPLLSNLYLTYAQTTIWDLGGDSSPFRDTSYRPGMYYRWVGSGKNLKPDEWRAGLEHESNGQGGAESRSINIAFIRPAWHIDLANGKRLSFLPKFYHYIEKEDNPDIQHFRGYADWQLRYGREDGLLINSLYRQGTGGYSTGQIDFSYPLSDRIFARTGSFVHLQLFSGYGETLLDYNRENDTQIRLGISLTR